MEIRKAEETDIKAIIALDTVVPRDSSRADYIKRVVASGEAWVAEIKHEVVGYAVLNRSFFGRATVDMLMVAEQWRRTGIGTALMKHLESLCSDSELWTSTNMTNTSMQMLLSQLGYVLTGRVDNLDPGDPELIFFKNLGE